MWRAKQRTHQLFPESESQRDIQCKEGRKIEKIDTFSARAHSESVLSSPKDIFLNSLVRVVHRKAVEVEV